VDELLAAANHVLDIDLGRGDVVGTYAGLRPLIAPSSGSTVTASREHRVVVEPNGMVRVSGGKYTTYRLMAEQTIDAALGVLGDRPSARPTGTRTHRLVGAADRPALDALAASIATSAGLEPSVAARLVARHGTEATDVAELGRETGLLGRLVDVDDPIEAEIVWAARHELALSIDDILSRRMRLSQELPDRGASVAPRVAELLGAELGWDADRRRAEVDAYLATAQAEFSVP
jgi:glycerol-3-phosphate dehydrogenase